jgi:predicted dehydrogenase
MGLVGGGQGAFIGRRHATAAVLDNRAALVAGCLSSSPDKAKASAPDYDIPPERAYTSIGELDEKERSLPADKRIDFVSVATPNHTHFEIAKAFAEAGFNVMCDKPLTFDLAQAEELAKVVDNSGVVFALTHNYTGYPLVRHAREMILSGELGEIQAIRSNYIQGWLRTRLETSEQKQAAWRTDPAKSGAAGAFGDIGTHAFNLAGFITGLELEELCAELSTFVEGRRVDDNCNVLLRYGGGDASFTSFHAGPGYLNLIREEPGAWWGRVIFYVADVDGLYARARAAGFAPICVPRPSHAGHQPSALLNEKLCGLSVSKLRPHFSHARC